MSANPDLREMSGQMGTMSVPDEQQFAVNDEAIQIGPIPRITIHGFFLSEASMRVAEAALEDRRLSKTHLKLDTGGIPAAIETFSQAPTPNLIIVESAGQKEDLVASLENLAEYCDAGTKVIVIGDVNDVSLYRDLISRGVSDYLITPISVLQLIASVGNLYASPEAEPLGRVIAFYGVKGGCGASTIAHNGAWSLARIFESEVVVTDLDLPFGTAGLDYNQDPLQGVFEAVSSPERLDETYLDRILTKCSEHLSLLAAPATLERTYDQGEKSFELLLETMRASMPHVVLDLPHAWNGWIRNTLLNVDEIVLVAEPDLANLRNAKNAADMLKQMRPNDRPPHLIMNKVNMPKRPEIKPDEFAGALGLTVQASIPFEPQLFGTAANNGQMIAELDGKHAITGMFDDLAQSVSGKAQPTRSHRSGLGGLLSKLKRKAG
ncbi:CpaE family protein [Labrenzia sp. 011]|uniref:AAA family ATPase n=1 Tax=Labrenzia sp. 011 TaxID=2171494 RepID=UPI000D519033|nr:CpaE family protein [Labrenzia sp. 011]PVB59374.1 CtpF protein [Labrenzia sp. 011]